MSDETKDAERAALVERLLIEPPVKPLPNGRVAVAASDYHNMLVQRIEAARLLSAPAEATEALRCEITKNECGTDTWGNGYTCPCYACRKWLRRSAEATERSAQSIEDKHSGYGAEHRGDRPAQGEADGYPTVFDVVFETLREFEGAKWTEGPRSFAGVLARKAAARIEAHAHGE